MAIAAHTIVLIKELLVNCPKGCPQNMFALDCRFDSIFQVFRRHVNQGFSRVIDPIRYLRCPSSFASGNAIVGVPSRVPTEMNRS